MHLEDKSKSLLPFLSSPKLLANEPEAEFQSGSHSILPELDKPTALAAALVSQLNESLWWIKQRAIDMELLRHEATARLLSEAGNHWDTLDNRQATEVVEHYLNVSAGKDDSAWIDESLAESRCTLSDLRVWFFKEAARHKKMVDDLIHRQDQTIRHLQRSVACNGQKSRLVKQIDLYLAPLEPKRSMKVAQTLDDKSSWQPYKSEQCTKKTIPDRRTESAPAPRIRVSVVEIVSSTLSLRLSSVRLPS